MTQRGFALGFVLLCGLLVCLPASANEIKKLRKNLNRAVAAKDSEDALWLLDEIVGIGGEEALAEVFDIGVELAKTPALYEATIKALRGMDGLYPYLASSVETAPKFTFKVFACDVLKGIETPEAANIVAPLLKDSNPFVQMSAVQTLESSMMREAVGPLIDFYTTILRTKSRDVLYYQVVDSLFNLTGHDFELIEDWHKWWEPVSKTFDPKETSTGGETAVTRKRRSRHAEFFGVPVYSKNICFVIDTSGSMRYVHKDDIPGLARGNGSDGGGASGGGGLTRGNQRLAEFWMRMAMAKRELYRCVQQIDIATRFNIIRFDNKAHMFRKKAIQATPAGKKKANKFIESLRFTPEGATHTLDALVKAFNADPKTNTIFFLSDGLPSVDGENNDPTDPILDKLFELNRFRKIKVFTFGFNPRTQDGQPMPQLSTANDWLKKLAKKTGGKFTAMRVDPSCTPDDPYGEKSKRKKKKKDSGSTKMESRAVPALLEDPCLLEDPGLLEDCSRLENVRESR